MHFFACMLFCACNMGFNLRMLCLRRSKQKSCIQCCDGAVLCHMNTLIYVNVMHIYIGKSLYEQKTSIVDRINVHVSYSGSQQIGFME